MPTDSEHKRILLDLWGGVFFDRMVNGAAQYARKNKNWTFIRILPWLGDTINMIRSVRPDGMIFYQLQPKVYRSIRYLRIPFVAVVEHTDVPAPLVCIDNEAIGVMAAEHFLDRGFRHFAFCGYSNRSWSTGRLKGYREKLKEAGFTAERCLLRWQRTGDVQAAMIKAENFIHELTKPCALFACHDSLASQLSEMCRRMQIRIPEQISLLGVDNQQSECEFCVPPLSSIITADHRIGYEAATLLDHLIRGGKPPDQPVHVPPAGVATRQSTDLLAVNEPHLAKAVKFIRNHAGKPLQVAQVAEHTGVSRTTLEQKFKQYIGRSPLEEIRRVHIERACDLLSNTDLAIAVVAAESGFAHPSNLTSIFRRATGMTPTQYRQMHHGTGTDE